MGTSTNQGSPSTPSWRAAQLAYRHRTISIDRAVQEIWRAATNQQSGDIAAGLSGAIVGECAAIVAAAPSREAAVATAMQRFALSGEASLAAVIAQRAVALSFAREGDRIAAFTSSLFEEASNYLVSRDLPGYVGPGWRAETVSGAIAFKASIREHVSQRVLEVERPATADALVGAWSGYVQTVVDRLRSVQRREQ